MSKKEPEATSTDGTGELMRRVRQRIRDLDLTDSQGAALVGVTPGSFARHLGGAYVRGDSMAKYRRWLASDHQAPRPSPRLGPKPTRFKAKTVSAPEPAVGLKAKPTRPHRVVDLFGGCGGLSLGFELAGGGGIYRTALAVDIEEQMVRVFNANHPPGASGIHVGRQADLAEFLNEAEVLAYYLDHVAATEADGALRAELDAIQPKGFARFLQEIRGCDGRFIADLVRARAHPDFLAAYARVPKQSLSQTSVLGFHKALKLPQAGTGTPNFEPPLWGCRTLGSAQPASMMDLPATLLAETTAAAANLWASELRKLVDRASGSGTGQLASAAGKIEESLGLIDGGAYAAVRRAWVQWRGHRDALRREWFEDELVLGQLRASYSADRAVHALLGGPPCQGFSRIGRGKIRSLREQSVHVQSDDHAGDKRNELMHQYVLFVAALSPRVFLFENVRHFQAEVKTPEGTFNATDILAEAISNLSHDGLDYRVSSRILTADEHFVPQTRERFFMLGVRDDVERRARRAETAKWCLSLSAHPPVLLKTALAGLPEPVYASAMAERPGDTADRVIVEDLQVTGTGPNAVYLQWIRQAPSAPGQDNRTVDAHCTRDSRPDDRAFFALLGPGKRWMDYRCDDNPIIADLAKLVQWAATARAGEMPGGLSGDRLKELGGIVDGSLSLRLLLDGIPVPPGENQHHLATPTYLKKRDGNHGDWLARLDSEAPSKTMVSHMGKDTYAYVHPAAPRTISVREAARVQTFPDWYCFGSVGLVDAYRVIGNAVPPLLSSQLAIRVAVLLEEAQSVEPSERDLPAGTKRVKEVPLSPG